MEGIYTELIGKTFTKVAVQDTIPPFCSMDEKNVNVIEFFAKSGEIYAMYHNRDCCEEVYIDDICGELEWLENSPILKAEVRQSQDNGKVKVIPDYGESPDESWTWTFYEFATLKGSVTLRWYGTSNGYYSEEVDIYKFNETMTHKYHQLTPIEPVPFKI